MKGAAVILVLMFVAAVGGFYAGKTTILPGSPYTPTQTESAVLASPVFASQTATVQGVITKVDGKIITVVGDKNMEDNFEVSDKLVIYKFTSGSPQASASSKLNSIDLNKNALIILELMENKYKVTSVSYLPPPPKP